MSPATQIEAERQLVSPNEPSFASSSAPQSASSCEAEFCAARLDASEPILKAAQRRWAARPLVERLQVLRTARHWMAAHPELFAEAIAANLQRTQSDTLMAELLPLLEAMRFLERNARKLLAPRRLGRHGRPIWLTGVHAEIYHVPLGHIAIIAPANFPLFLPGVQAVQALMAGNAVTWKPGNGGTAVAILLTHALRQAGLPRGVLHVTEDSIEAGRQTLALRPDKVIFTGSFTAGQQILHTLADTATPSVMELSGADACVVLPSAELAAVARAIAFGLRLNGAEVCMSPRRVVATRETLQALRPLLNEALAAVPPVHLKPQTAHSLKGFLQQAASEGATVSALTNSELPTQQTPILVENATPEMAITRADLFAPVVSLLEAPSVLHIAEIVNNNPFGLTASIFGAPAEAGSLAAELRVGTVVINDLIAPTADPRVPFGGRGNSGFGVTRGAEGLLEMTSTKTILRRNKPATRHYDPLAAGDLSLTSSLVGVLHGGSFRQRWSAFSALIRAARARTR